MSFERVLVTGGTGSLGRTLIRRLLAADAHRIIVYSRDEYKQARLDAELGDPRLRFFLGDVRDPERLAQAMHHVDAVAHTAALKRVDRVSSEAGEAVKTNVLGSANVIQAAIDANVPRVLLISSDKCVEAINFYGHTKALMESYGIQANAYGWARGTRISVARWGNVLDSRGAVLHTWRRTLKEGKPLPVTDPRMTRFWLTLRQAAGLAYEVLTSMRGGEIWVPVLPAGQILDLAEALAPGYPTECVGLRPGGEKLHESLLTGDEIARTVPVPFAEPQSWYIIQPAVHPWAAEWPWMGPMLDVPAGWRYASDVATPRLSPMLLRGLLEQVQEEPA